MTQNPYRTVFVLQEHVLDAPVEIYSNRQYVYRWIEENGLVFDERSGKPPKQISNYRQLCRLLEERHSIRLMAIRTGQEPVRYNLIKAPIISK